MQQPAPLSFGTALAFWFKLGWISFGGPAGQIALMHEELVVRRRWISERRFLHALNYCMLLPGPEAQQLATYIGWLMHRTAGGLLAGGLFVLPSLLILTTLSWVYMAYGHTTLVAGLFYGIKPAVTAIVVQAAWRIGLRTLRHPLHRFIALAAFAAIAFGQAPFPAVIAAAALIGAVAGQMAPQLFTASAHPAPAAAPSTGAPALGPALIDDGTPSPAHALFKPLRVLLVLLVGAALWSLGMLLLAATQGWNGTLAQMARFFTQAALLTFGGAYAVLPYVTQAAVEHFHWLSLPQMIDGLALGETTPGPLIMVVTYVGFLGGWNHAAAAGMSPAPMGMLAACVATAYTFLPSFVFILAGGPLVESTRSQLRLAAPLGAITSSVVGVIASLALFFAWHVLWPHGQPQAWHSAMDALHDLDVMAAGLMVAAVLALLHWKRSVVQVIAACALAGLVFKLLT